MSQMSNQDIINCRANLLRAKQLASNRTSVALNNRQNKASYEKQLLEVTQQLEDIHATAEHCTRLYKNIKHYAIEHQKTAKDILNIAIAKAGELVPDADVQGIHLNYTESNRVTVVNGKGQNVALREGGAFTSILGALMRYACIKAQPEAIPLILFDESFFTLSDTTTEYTKDVFNEMKKDITIICIEQRRNVVSGITDQEYVFKKGLDNVTEVTRVL